MTSPTDLELLSDLTRACASPDSESLHATALPLVLELCRARSCLVLRGERGGALRVAGAGASLPGPDHDALVAAAHNGSVWPVPVPPAWQAAGVTRIDVHGLPGDALLVLAWGEGAPGPATQSAVDVLVSAEARLHAESALLDLRSRVDNAQQLASMGDYDWHIRTDTNQWSDQLYRIYGHEPQSFNPSYERFLSLIHPEDRERISAIHQRAYVTGEPYQMIERIVRPDGETRYLSSNGQVVMDAQGRPTRMRGTCVDITERVLADQEREHIAARFRALVESSPDAILLHDGGVVVQANGRAEELLGGDPCGHAIDEIVPPAQADVGRGVRSQGLDGRPRLLDVMAAELSRVDDDGLVAVFLSDAGPRLAREELVATVREAEVRRRQALELNDNVVQGLTAALLALEGGDEVASYLRLTLDSARRMMSDWLDPLHHGELGAGDLVRSEAATLERRESRGAPEPSTEAPAETSAGSEREEAVGPPGRSGLPRVLVVDDCEDVRTLLRLRLTSTQAYDVVGEASNGRQAVDLAGQLRPDVVLLDLAMPVMDGLEALPRIRAAVPGVHVIVLSGFDRSVTAHKAIAAGADRYLEKGKAVSEIVEALDEVLAAQDRVS